MYNLQPENVAQLIMNDECDDLDIDYQEWNSATIESRAELADELIHMLQKHRPIKGLTLPESKSELVAEMIEKCESYLAHWCAKEDAIKGITFRREAA